MRKLIFLSLSIFFSSFTFSQGIEFYKGNYKDAFIQADSEDKLVFVDAFAVWCGPCKRMAAQVFPQKAVGDFFNVNFVNMKIDMEKGQGLDFRKTYPVSAFPTFFFIDGQGKVVHKFTGGRDVNGFIAEAKKAVEKFDQSAKYANLWDEGNRDYFTAYNYIKGLNRSGKSSLKIANEYLSTQKNLGSEDNLKLILEACTEVDSRIFDLVVQYKKEIISLYNIETIEEKIISAATNTFDKSIEFDSPSLEKLALNAVKKHAKSKYKGFLFEGEMKKAESGHDVKSYVENASKYNKQVIKDNEKEQHKLTENLMSRFSKEVEALKLANTIALELALEKDNCENCLLVSNTYVKLKDVESAKKWAYKAQLAAGDDKNQQMKVAQLIRRLESIK
jgi:thiol-disulfide isomerase/thioredoxin